MQSTSANIHERRFILAMKVTIIFDNMPPVIKGLRKGWGFAALVEVGASRKILFDTGQDGKILLNNMKVLGIQPDLIQEIFISHPHYDHVGGLPAFLEKNNKVKVWAPPAFKTDIKVKEISFLSKPTELYEGVYSTGELEGIEQSLVVSTTKGLVIIAGCSHPRMESILAAASKFGTVYGIIGGLHSTHPQSLAGLGLICATHCTKRKAEIKRLYPHAYLEGGAGRVIEIK